MSDEKQYTGEDCRAPVQLSDEQLEDIAKRAYKLATDNIYLEVGKAAVRAAVLVIGAALLTLGAYLGFDWKGLK